MKKIIVLFLVAFIYGCNDPQLVEPKLKITDQMLIDLNTAIVNNLSNIEESKVTQLLSKYDSFDDFMIRATRSERNQLESIFAFNDPIINQIFGKRKFSQSEFISLKNRFLEVFEIKTKSDPSGRVATPCDDLCTDYSMGVWWDRFHFMQSIGSDMFQAAAFANAARSDAYTGCMYGCVQVPQD